MRGLLATLALAVSAAACSGSASTMAPCPNQPAGQEILCPAKGSAHVEVTGSRTATFDAPLYTEGNSSSASFSSGVVQLGYRNEAHDQFNFAAAKTTLDPQHPGGVVIGVQGSLYVSGPGAPECTVTFETADDTGISGSFVCTAITSSEGATIEASGTFDASA